MSQVRRHDLRPADSDVARMEDNQFKKSFQTIGRPEVTERDIHEDYMKNPPNVSPRGVQVCPSLPLLYALADGAYVEY